MERSRVTSSTRRYMPCATNAPRRRRYRGSRADPKGNALGQWCRWNHRRQSTLCMICSALKTRASTLRRSPVARDADGHRGWPLATRWQESWTRRRQGALRQQAQQQPIYFQSDGRRPRYAHGWWQLEGAGGRLQSQWCLFHRISFERVGPSSILCRKHERPAIGWRPEHGVPGPVPPGVAVQPWQRSGLLWWKRCERVWVGAVRGCWEKIL